MNKHKPAKTKSDTTVEMDAFAIPGAATPGAAIPDAAKAQEQARAALESGFGQFRNSFETAQAALEKNGTAFQGTLEAVAAHGRQFGEKSFELAKSNAAATLAFTSALFQAKSFSDLIELQSSHARKAMESLLVQSKELASLAQKGAADIGAKAKDMLAVNG
jgi:hypothetical protein